MGRNDTERQQDRREPVADEDAAIGSTMAREGAPDDGGDDLAGEPGTMDEVSALDADHPVVAGPDDEG